MTIDELKALPQSAFCDHHPPGNDDGRYVCLECQQDYDYNKLHYHVEAEGVFDHYSAVCPTCFASHPTDAVPERRFFIDLSPERHLVVVPLRYFKDGHIETTSLSAEWFGRHPGTYREIQEPEAGAWAEKHGYAKALFGEEPEEWPKYAVWDNATKPTVYRCTEPTFYQWVRVDGLRTTRKTAWSHIEGLKKCDKCTESAARAYAAKHNIPWPSEWGSAWAEEMEPKVDEKPEPCDECRFTVFGIPCIHESDIAVGKCPQFAGRVDPAPSAPQPVGYSCKKCGTVLDDDAHSTTGWGQCNTCHLGYQFAPLQNDVQPGPQPGPWQTDPDMEWTGEYRDPVKGEWVLAKGTIDHPWVVDHQWCPGDPRHILRPKPKPAEKPPRESLTKDSYYENKPTPRGKDVRTMSDEGKKPKPHSITIPLPSIKTIAKYAVVWPIVKTIKAGWAYVRNPRKTIKWAAWHVGGVVFVACATSDHFFAIAGREAIAGMFVQAYEGTLGRWLG